MICVTCLLAWLMLDIRRSSSIVSLEAFHSVLLLLLLRKLHIASYCPAYDYDHTRTCALPDQYNANQERYSMSSPGFLKSFPLTSHERPLSSLSLHMIVGFSLAYFFLTLHACCQFPNPAAFFTRLAALFADAADVTCYCCYCHLISSHLFTSLASSSIYSYS